MDDFISRKAAIQSTSVWNGDVGTEAWIRDALEKLPAADVRPVVLCRDCEYWKQWDNTTHYLCTYVAGAKFIRNAEDFCSRGVKREES